jgi:hypothetical protein
LHSGLKLAGKVEFDLRIVLALCIQEPFALREVYQVAILIFHNVALLEAYKIFNGFFIAGYPASFVEGQGYERA